MKLKAEVDQVLYRRHMLARGGKIQADIKDSAQLPVVESIAETDVLCAQRCRDDGGLKSISGAVSGALSREIAKHSGTEAREEPASNGEHPDNSSSLHLENHEDDQQNADLELHRMPADTSECPLGLTDARFLQCADEHIDLATRHETVGELSPTPVAAADSLVRHESSKPSLPSARSFVLPVVNEEEDGDEDEEEDGDVIHPQQQQQEIAAADALLQVEDTPWHPGDGWTDRKYDDDDDLDPIAHVLCGFTEDELSDAPQLPESVADDGEGKESTTFLAMDDSPREEQQLPIYSPDSDLPGCPTIVVTKDDCENAEHCPQEKPGERVLKSVLKKGRGQNQRRKGRVTFDEAVTLYSDEYADVQVLALRTADLSYADVFYMFEPPLEYQDLLPFEPPAEYRDPDDTQECVQTLPELLPEECEVFDSVYGDYDSYAEETGEDFCQQQDIHESPADGGDGLAVSMATSVAFQSKASVNDPHDEQANVEISRCDEVLQRFVEAESGSSQDELSSVFSNLDEELALEGKNGTFDDDFFRKLLHLLSSLEGNNPLQLEDDDLFTSTDFCLEGSDVQSDDTSEATLKCGQEVDSDCSLSSQDTIIIKTSDDSDRNEQDIGEVSESSAQCSNDVSFSSSKLNEDHQDGEPLEEGVEVVISGECSVPENTEQLSTECNSKKGESASQHPVSTGNISAQTSTEEPSIGDTVQETDDSTSSDSRSGDVEDDCRQDDVGYDEEDAEDDDDESLKGMAQSNSKIRRIIKRNAIQCTLLRGIEARRRETGNYARPKSPLPSRNSLVEQLRWLTTVEETNDDSTSSKEPKVPQNNPLENVNARMVQSFSTSSEEEQQLPINRPIPVPRAFQEPTTENRVLPQYRPLNPNSTLYAPIRPNPSPTQHPGMMRRWLAPDPTQQQRVVARVTVPGDFRDWRVVQRVVVNRDGVQQQVIRGAFKSQFAQRMPIPGQPQPIREPILPRPDVTCVERVPEPKIPRPGPFVGNTHDELEQFVKQDIERIERIRKRYSLAEEDDDPTFGFGRRPSVRGIRTKFGSTTEIIKHLQTTASSAPLSSQSIITSHGGAVYATPVMSEELQARLSMDPSHPQMGPPNPWTRPGGIPGHVPLYRPTPLVKEHQTAFEIHRASVAMGDLPPHVGPMPDGRYYPTMEHRYHSYAENIYGSTRSLNPPGWNIGGRGTSPLPHATPAVVQPKIAPPPPSIQPPPPPRNAPVTPQPIIYSYATKDERGTPEGASSSPKVSSDSLYHGTPSDQPSSSSDPSRKDGVIYYSLNV